jgi:hypothetical protein
VNSSEAGGGLILQSRCMNGDEMDWFAIKIAWLIVRMAKQSSVATRRHHDAVNGPWVKTHGYPHMSRRDIRVVISRHDADAFPAPVRENGARFCKYDYDSDWGIQKNSWALRLRAKNFF